MLFASRIIGQQMKRNLMTFCHASMDVSLNCAFYSSELLTIGNADILAQNFFLLAAVCID